MRSLPAWTANRSMYRSLGTYISVLWMRMAPCSSSHCVTSVACHRSVTRSCVSTNSGSRLRPSAVS
eukprot:6035238-Pleurochrysis_carterae.AAC.1